MLAMSNGVNVAMEGEWGVRNRKCWLIEMGVEKPVEPERSLRLFRGGFESSAVDGIRLMDMLLRKESRAIERRPSP